jgi:DNA-directed RNA polymerase subunit RPC12/RpoP
MKLSDENAKIQMFVTQSAEYEIHETAAGSIVYRSKPSADGKISTYYLCANCYQQRIISILQPTGRQEWGSLAGAHVSVSQCPQCRADILMHKIPYDNYDMKKTGAFKL